MRRLNTLVIAIFLSVFPGLANAQSPSEVVSTSCLSGGLGEAYCACYSSEFEALSSQLSSMDAKLYLTTFAGGMSVLGTTETTRLQTQLPVSERMQAMQLMPQVIGLKELCEGAEQITDLAANIPTEPDTRSAGVRDFVDSCVADGSVDSTESCACVAHLFSSELSLDEFRIMTASQRANAVGADPVEAIAKQFGIEPPEAMAKLTSFAPRLAAISQSRARDLAVCSPK